MIYYGIWITHEDGGGAWMRQNSGMIFYTPSWGHALAQADSAHAAPGIRWRSVEARVFPEPKES